MSEVLSASFFALFGCFCVKVPIFYNFLSKKVVPLHSVCENGLCSLKNVNKNKCLSHLQNIEKQKQINHKYK